MGKPLYKSMKHLIRREEECSKNIAAYEIYFGYDYEWFDDTQFPRDLNENEVIF